MDKVAVLIPCYNEAAAIKKVVEDFKRVLPEGGVVYVYDNNSKDGTAEIARAAGAVVRHEYQQGKGNVLSCFNSGVRIFYNKTIPRLYSKHFISFYKNFRIRL